MTDRMVHFPVPELTLAAIDEARGGETREAWILGAIGLGLGLRLSPLPDVIVAAVAPDMVPPGLAPVTGWD